MKCEQIRKHFPDLLADDLDESIKSKVQAHLASCTACMKEWESMSALWEKMEMLPEEQPSKALHARFNSMLEAYKQGLQQVKPAPQWREALDGWLERWWPRRPAFQFALALALLVVGLIVGNIFTVRERSNGEFAQLRSEVQSMRQMVSLSLLQQRSPSDRLQGVSFSQEVEKPDEEMLSALLDTLNNDSNVNVRIAAVDALYLFHDKPHVRAGLIRSFSQQSSPLVQIALIDLMVEIRERRSIEALKKLIQTNKLNPIVKERAQWGIKQLT